MIARLFDEAVADLESHLDRVVGALSVRGKTRVQNPEDVPSQDAPLSKADGAAHAVAGLETFIGGFARLLVQLEDATDRIDGNHRQHERPKHRFNGMLRSLRRHLHSAGNGRQSTVPFEAGGLVAVSGALVALAGRARAVLEDHLHLVEEDVDVASGRTSQQSMAVAETEAELARLERLIGGIEQRIAPEKTKEAAGDPVRELAERRTALQARLVNLHNDRREFETEAAGFRRFLRELMLATSCLRCLSGKLNADLERRIILADAAGNADQASQSDPAVEALLSLRRKGVLTMPGAVAHQQAANAAFFRLFTASGERVPNAGAVEEADDETEAERPS